MDNLGKTQIILNSGVSLFHSATPKNKQSVCDIKANDTIKKFPGAISIFKSLFSSRSKTWLKQELIIEIQ
jgi:hypothetical protein